MWLLVTYYVRQLWQRDENDRSFKYSSSVINILLRDLIRKLFVINSGWPIRDTFNELDVQLHVKEATNSRLKGTVRVIINRESYDNCGYEWTFAMENSNFPLRGRSNKLSITTGKNDTSETGDVPGGHRATRMQRTFVIPEIRHHFQSLFSLVEPNNYASYIVDVNVQLRRCSFAMMIFHYSSLLLFSIFTPYYVSYHVYVRYYTRYLITFTISLTRLSYTV